MIDWLRRVIGLSLTKIARFEPADRAARRQKPRSRR